MPRGVLTSPFTVTEYYWNKPPHNKYPELFTIPVCDSTCFACIWISIIEDKNNNLNTYFTQFLMFSNLMPM